MPYNARKLKMALFDAGYSRGANWRVARMKKELEQAGVLISVRSLEYHLDPLSPTMPRADVLAELCRLAGIKVEDVMDGGTR